MEKKQRKQKPKGLLEMEKSEARFDFNVEPSLFSMEQLYPQTKGNLLEMILEKGNILAASFKVYDNKGSAGIDKVTVHELGEYMQEHWEGIRLQILDGTYRPSPVRRVEIPKSDGSKRLLGIPTVIDRVIQQAILQKLNPIFDPEFSESSYGFRVGRSAHDAIQKAKEFVAFGYDWVVDIDLEKFFDKIQHEVLMKRLMRKIEDKRVLDLTRKYLTSGILLNGVCISSKEGTPQGGPLSPLLANVMLDDLDKELEKRGHKFCRYADDCNIYVQSEKAGLRVMESVTKFLTNALKLKVNEKKSAVGRPADRKFLGFTIVKHNDKTFIRISDKSIEKFKDKVREITRFRKGVSIEERLTEIRPFFRGWLQYYAKSEFQKTFQNLDGWTRRRLRGCLLTDWKKRARIAKELIKLGMSKRQAYPIGYSSQGVWSKSNWVGMKTVLKNSYWKDLGYFCLSLHYSKIRHN